MSGRNSNNEGGMLPLVVLLGLMCLILVYGVQQGFLSRHDPLAGKKIRLVLAVGGPDVTPYQEAVDRFESKHPDIGVEIRTISGSKYYQKLLVMMASGDPPDLMWMGEGFGEFAQRGAFLDVSRFVKRDVDTRRFVPQSLQWYRVNGRQLGVPFLLDVEFMIYNKDLFDQAGLPYPTNNWDYDLFLHDAQRLTVRDDHHRITRYGFFGQLDPCLFDAQFISSDGTHATCDTPQMIDYLKVNGALVNKYRVSPTIQQQNTLDRYFLFASGRAAMMQAFTWDLMPLHQQCASIRWGYVLNPKITRRGEWASSQAVLISAKTKHPDEAWQLCREFLSPEFQRSMANIGLPSDLSVARELAATGQTQYNHLSTLIDAVGELYPTPRVAHLSEARQIFQDACQSVWSGLSSPQDAMERASHMMDRMLQEQRRYGS